MKTIFLIILIALILSTAAAAGYMYYSKKNLSLPILPEPDTLLVKNPTATIVPTKKREEPPKPTQDTEADNLLQNFYDYYTSCLAGHYATTPTKKQPSKSPQEDCPYNQTGALTDQLALKLKPIVGYDPILCSQNIPTNTTHDPLKIIGNKALSIVHEEFAQTTSPKNQKSSTEAAQINQNIAIAVELEFQNAQWQISNITCPK
jgi:hypothetical protein